MRPRLYQALIPLHAAQMGAPPLFPTQPNQRFSSTIPDESHILQIAFPSLPDGIVFLWNAPSDLDVVMGDDIAEEMEVDTPRALDLGEPMDVVHIRPLPKIHGLTLRDEDDMVVDLAHEMGPDPIAVDLHLPHILDMMPSLLGTTASIHNLEHERPEDRPSYSDGVGYSSEDEMRRGELSTLWHTPITVQHGQEEAHPPHAPTDQSQLDVLDDQRIVIFPTDCEDQLVDELTESFRCLGLHDDDGQDASCEMAGNSGPELPVSGSSLVDPSIDAVPPEADNAPASRFHIFSNLESSFDEKQFTYLSALESYEPLSNRILGHHTTQDASPATNDRLADRFGRFGGKLKAKTALRRKEKRGSPIKFETPRKARMARQHPYRSNFTPLPSTDHRLASNQDPFETTLANPLRRADFPYKELISESAFKDLWSHIPSPPPSPILSWANSLAERKARLQTTNLVSDDSQTAASVSPTNSTTDYPSPSTPPEIEIKRTRTTRPANRYFSEVFLTPPFVNDPSTWLDIPDYIRCQLPPFRDRRPPLTGWASESVHKPTTQKDLSLENPTPTPPAQFAQTPLPREEEKLEADIIKPDDEAVFPGAYPIHDLEDSVSSDRPSLFSQIYPKHSPSFARWVVELTFGW